MPPEEPMDLPTVESSKVLYQGFGQLRCDTLRLPNQKLYDYYTFVTTAEAVMVLPQTADGRLLLNEEYRHPTQQVLLGLPGGLIDDGEDPISGGKRELLEETGYQGEDWKFLGKAYPFPGASSQSLNFVSTSNVTRISEPSLEGSEILRPILLTPLELQKRIEAGHPIDGALCMALFFFQHQANSCNSTSSEGGSSG